MATVKYKAILIANWTYDDANFQPLNGPKQDLDALKAALTDVHCGLFDEADITLIPDKDVTFVRNELADFLGGAARDEALLIYFSGHAVPVRNNLVLCMKETELNKPLAQGVPVSYINESLPESRSEQTIVILDCCYAGRSTKGSATVDLSFAQNLYCLASSGAYELTPDAKSKGTPSPFTAELSRLLVDQTIAADQHGAVTMDAVWERLQSFKTKPLRSAAGRGSLLIARRGDLRGEEEQVLDPLEWLPKGPKVYSVELKVSTEGISAKWEGVSGQCQRLDISLRGFMSRALELIDGVGRLKEEDGSEQWRGVVHDFWRTLGQTLMRSALPEGLRSYIGRKVAECADDEIVKIELQLDDPDYEQCPWEALHGGDGDVPKIQDFLSLTDGILVERACEVRRPLPQAAGTECPYGIWSAHLSLQDTSLSSQIVRELESRAPALGASMPPNNSLGKKCSWKRFLGAPPVQLLVLTLPLRRLADGTIDIGFNLDDRVEWKKSEEVLARLERWRIQLKGVIVETVASPPSFNAHRASVDFARQVTQRGLGAAAYLCHTPAFPSYPLDDRGVPVTFAGQVVSALLKGAEFAPAVHHARSAPLRLNSGIKQAFGFPGYYWPKASLSSGGAGRLGKQTSAESVMPSAEKGASQGGGKLSVSAGDDNG